MGLSDGGVKGNGREGRAQWPWLKGGRERELRLAGVQNEKKRERERREVSRGKRSHERSDAQTYLGRQKGSVRERRWKKGKYLNDAETQL